MRIMSHPSLGLTTYSDTLHDFTSLGRGGIYRANPSNSIFYICKIGTVFSRKKGRGLVEINYRFCFSIICSFCSSDFTYLTKADCGKN